MKTNSEYKEMALQSLVMPYMNSAHAHFYEDLKTELSNI